MTVRADCVCGRRLDVDRNLAGKRVECPECHRQVYIPGLADSEPEQPAARKAAPAPPRQLATSELPVVEPVAMDEPVVVDFEPPAASQPKPQPQKRRPARPKDRRRDSDVAAPAAGGTMCPFCGASVPGGSAGNMLHCPKCDSEFSDLPPRRRKKRKKRREEPTSKYRSVKNVVADNKESFPLWAKWTGLVVAGVFGFVVILQIFAGTAKNIEKQAMEEAIVNGIQNKYREMRHSNPAQPTVQINDLELGEENEDGLKPFTASRSIVIVKAGAGSPIYGLVDPKSHKWVLGTSPIDAMDSPNVEMKGTISEETRTAYGAATFLVMLIFAATLFILARKFVF